MGIDRDWTSPDMTAADRLKPEGSALALLPALRRFFRRRVPADAVDDLVQEVFASLQARKADSLIENMEAYLFVVARNVLSKHRMLSGRAFPDLEGLQLEAICDEAPLPDRQLLGKEALGLALQAIETMTERTRQVFLMHRFDDMTYAAIARQLGISVSAVEKHIMIALQVLLKATDVAR